MKTLLLIIAIALTLTLPAAAARVVIMPPGVYCAPCYGACPYAGYPCPAGWTYYYYNPNNIYSYDQNYRYGGYQTPGNAYNYGGYYAPGSSVGMSPFSQFPPYLGIDASQQWFAQPR